MRVAENHTLFSAPSASRFLVPAYSKALAALKARGLTFLVLRLPVDDGEPPRDLDILVSNDSLRGACEALRGAGFHPLTAPAGLPSKVEFAHYDGTRFCSLDVHTSVVAEGLVYLDSSSLLRRRVMDGEIPLPSPEDLLLHLVLHPFLSRREVGGKYSERIRGIAALGLDRDYMAGHLSRFGLGEVFEELLSGVQGRSTPQVDKLWALARRRLLLRVPGNLLKRAGYRLASHFRLGRRAGLVAFLGVDGVGKTSLVASLQRLLSERGLRTGSVYLGSWGNYQTGAVWVRSYSPRDHPPEGEARGAAVVRVLKNTAKFELFYGGLLYEQMVRYRKGVVRSPADLVLSDRYIYDLEIPFSRQYIRAGRRLRRWIYNLFPAPDLVFHLQADPRRILERKAELKADEIERFDGIYREILAGRPVIRLAVEDSPEVLAQQILERHWQELLKACWKHAPSNPLRSLGVS